VSDPSPSTDARIQGSQGQPPPIDPTANVLQLVAAAMLRQDDLREAEARHRDAMSDLRDKLSREIRDAERNGQRDLALAESRRIDALIEALDQRVTLESSKAELTAVALAERVDASAKALAASVDASAKALAATVETTAKTLSERIVPLEQFRYEQAGSHVQRSEGRSQNQWIIGLVMGVPSALLALVAVVVLLTK
jgi:rubrerythrin